MRIHFEILLVYVRICVYFLCLSALLTLCSYDNNITYFIINSYIKILVPRRVDVSRDRVK